MFTFGLSEMSFCANDTPSISLILISTKATSHRNVSAHSKASLANLKPLTSASGLTFRILSIRPFKAISSSSTAYIVTRSPPTAVLSSLTPYTQAASSISTSSHCSASSSAGASSMSPSSMFSSAPASPFSSAGTSS